MEAKVVDKNAYVRHGCDASRVPDLSTALSRLDKFSFIGLQEQWATSICLFHMKLGGHCHAIEVANSRNARSDNSHTEYSSTYRDPIDSVLYAVIKQRFEAELVRYNVKNSTCRARCPDLADSFTGSD